MTRAALALGVMLVSAGLGPRAWAQAPGDKAQAAKLLDQGLERFDAGDHATALARFEEAYAAYPSPKILLNIGEAHRKLGHRARAVQAFDAFLTETASLPEVGDARVAAARKAIAELRPSVGRIIPDVSPSEAVITLDGEPVGRASSVRTLYVEPGEHEIAAAADRHARKITRVTVAAGAERPAELALERIPEPAAAASLVGQPAAPAMRSTKPAWIAAGTSAVLLLAAGGVGLHARGLFADLKDASARGDAARWDEIDPKVRREQLLTNVLLAAGGAAAVTSAVLMLRARPSGPEPALTVAPTVAAGPGLTLAARF